MSENQPETFLFIDTETTGFKKAGALIQEGQARVCQIALLLTDAEGKSLAEFSALIDPDGSWKISEGARKIHGFTDELCVNFGIRQAAMLLFYQKMLQKADLVIAHNEDFDKSMMEIEVSYYLNHERSRNENIIQKPWFCTMKSNAHITGGKWPKLEEALQHYCGRSLGDTAHDAMYDVKACRDIFFEMRKRKAAAA